MSGAKPSRGNDILVLTDNFLETGNLHNRQLQELVKLCVAKNKTLTIISVSAPQKDKWHKGQYRHIGLGCHAAQKASALNKIKASVLLRLTLMKLQPHKMVLLDAASYPHQYILSKWALSKKIAQIYWAHTIYPEALNFEMAQEPEQAESKPDKKMKQLLKNMKLTVCNNLSIYKYLSHNGVDTRRLKVIAADCTTLTKASKKTIKTAPQKNHSHLKKDPIDQKFRILFSGEINRGKACATVLEVAQKFQDKNPEIEFIFSGYGGGVSWLKSERERLSLNNIKLMPLQPAPSYLTFLETGDVHLALQDEGAGNVKSFSAIEQSWAVQRPCIYIGDMKSENALALKKSETGVVVEAGDSHKLLKAVLGYRMEAEKWFAAHEKAKELNISYDQKPLEDWLAVISKAMTL
jgi:glycosyltransferase involved in cell wall biosynthesis